MLLEKLTIKVFKEPRLILKFFSEMKKSGLKGSLNKVRSATSNNFIKNDSKDRFFDHYFQNIDKQDSEYKGYIQHKELNNQLKLIAFYLPQFHTFPENDKFWGKGFTEWTNVTKAIPQFEGHYQPKLAGELGYYDLTVEEIQKQQINLAKNYGLSGFCYYYYWFGGTKVMNRPIENILKNKDLDFPFCISWANENWTRRWDGDDSNVLLGQDHSPEDDISFIQEISKYMVDNRYIKINGKPVLVIYRPTLFPDIKSTTERWRKWCQTNGIGDIYLVTTHQVFDSINPNDIGFDAAIEFSPMTQLRESQVEGIEEVTLFNNNFQGMVLDYDTLLSHVTEYIEPYYTKFRGVTPSWDNEARKTGKGVVFHNSSPAKYQKWLEYILEYTKDKRETSEQFVFINAWNEWAEGAMLEPDRKYGYGYLEATYKALEMVECVDNLKDLNKTHKVAIIIHLYYIDTWVLFKELLNGLSFEFDLFITTSFDQSLEVKDLVLSEFKDSHVLAFANRGRDVLPFIELYKELQLLNYKYICKLHSKQSKHLEDGIAWGEQTITNLLQNSEEIFKIFESNEKVGVIAPKGCILKNKDYLASNKNGLIHVANFLKIDDILSTYFVGGTMMWFRPEALTGLDDLFNKEDFQIENGQVDGTVAHTIERVISCLATYNEYITSEIDSGDSVELPKQYQS